MSNYDRPIDQLLKELPASVKSQPNLTRRATIGLSELYAEIRNSTIFPHARQLPPFTLQDNELNVVPSELPVMIARYKCIEHVADGTFSQIFRATDLFKDSSTGGRPVAIKMMHRLCGVLGFRELTMLYHLQSTCRHTNSAYTFSFQGRVAIVMEYYPFTLIDVFQQPRELRSALSGAVLKQPRAIRQENFAVPAKARPTTNIHALRHLASILVKALWLLNEKGIIHADIKPENVFLRPVGGGVLAKTSAQGGLDDEMLLEGDIRLGDFGNSLHVSEAPDYFKDFEIQSLPYRAPEVLMRHPFDTAIDMWSLGVLLVEVYLQEPLFTVTTKQQLHAAIEQKLGPIVINPRAKKGSFLETGMPGSWKMYTKPLEGCAGYLQAIRRLLLMAPSDFVTFVAGLLQADPSKRLTPLTALRHPFLSGTNDLTSAILLNPAITTPSETYAANYDDFETRYSAEVKPEKTQNIEPPVSKRTSTHRSVLEHHLKSDGAGQAADGETSRLATQKQARHTTQHVPAQPEQSARSSSVAAAKREYGALELESSSDSEPETISSQQSDQLRLRRYHRGSSPARQNQKQKSEPQYETDDALAQQATSDTPAPRRRRTNGSLPMFAQLGRPLTR